MQPNSQPTPQDIASVSAHLGEQPAPQPAPTPEPAPQPAPAQQQPAPVTPQPAPTQEPSDPFAQLFASEPAEPAQSVTEPANPLPTGEPAPVEPVAQPQPQVEQPAPQPQPQAQTQEYETYDEYIARVTASVPAAPAQPSADNVDPNDPAAIQKFFDDLVNTAVSKSTTELARKEAIRTAERQAWEDTFGKYGSLRTNKGLRDMVHNIRVGYMQRGIAMTPTQAADKLLQSLGQERRAGAVGEQVVTTYEAVQPNGGGSGAPVQTDLDVKQTFERVQDGGEAALADILDQEIKAGRTW